jgi:hypothetical protein
MNIRSIIVFVTALVLLNAGSESNKNQLKQDWAIVNFT